MPKRQGKGMQQLLETIADMQYCGLAVEGHGKLSTAQRKSLREHLRMRAMLKKQRQLRGLDLMMEASAKLGLYDAELEGVPTRSGGRRK